jgi:membrane-associated protein
MVGVKDLVDFIFHIDKYISLLMQNFGIFTYFILFIVIFCETGLVITPFLPGDSLIFVLGAFAAKGIMNIFILYIVLAAAAILGDSFNYWIGSYFGEKVFAKSKLFHKEYLERTKEFYKKHGGKTIVLARFVPIIRTFAPFVAGVGKMNYGKFIVFNIIGGLIWVALFLSSGYFFGELPFIENNLTLVILIIIFVSLIPPALEFFKHYKKK